MKGEETNKKRKRKIETKNHSSKLPEYGEAYKHTNKQRTKRTLMRQNRKDAKEKKRQGISDKQGHGKNQTYTVIYESNVLPIELTRDITKNERNS